MRPPAQRRLGDDSHGSPPGRAGRRARRDAAVGARLRHDGRRLQPARGAAPVQRRAARRGRRVCAQPAGACTRLPPAPHLHPHAMHTHTHTHTHTRTHTRTHPMRMHMRMHMRMPCRARWQLRLVNHACGSAANTELAWVPPPADAAGAEAEACPCGLGHYAARARRPISAGEELSYSCACRATEPAPRAATSGAAPLTPRVPGARAQT